MRLSDVIRLRSREGGGEPIFMKSARKMLKRMNQVKDDNPKPSDTPSGWRADPHQGAYNGMNMRLNGT